MFKTQSKWLFGKPVETVFLELKLNFLCLTKPFSFNYPWERYIVTPAVFTVHRASSAFSPPSCLPPARISRLNSGAHVLVSVGLSALLPSHRESALLQELWYVFVLPLPALRLNSEVLPSPTTVKPMRRRVRCGKRRRAVGRITNPSKVRKNYSRSVKSCPTPTPSPVYSSSASNSEILVKFLSQNSQTI